MSTENNMNTKHNHNEWMNDEWQQSSMDIENKNYQKWIKKKN